MPRTPDCALEFEGESVSAVAGEPVAVSLFAAGVKVLSRSIKYHRPRSFFCLAGHCGACLMRIDGQPNIKACRTLASEGMKVERQNAFPSGGLDVLAAADFFFPKGMDHHTMFTAPRAVNTLMQKVVRQLGGLGRLPDPSPEPQELPAGERLRVDVAVVGAGPAGLAAAIACAAPGRRVVVFDEGDRAGGSLLSHPAHGVAAADRLAAEARAAGVAIRCRASAIAWYPEDEGGLLAVAEQPEGGGLPRLVRVTAARYVYATGGYDVNALFEDNDRPGIFAARAVGTMLIRHGVLAGARPVVLGDGPYAAALCEALAAAGCKVMPIDGVRERVVAARGRAWVSGVDVQSDGKTGPVTRKIACDAVAVATLPAPASELARQHGAEVAFRPEGGGFAVLTDGNGATRTPGVHACGDVCGFRGVLAARLHGSEVGRAIARAFARPGEGA